ncbi:MAG: hypothetical protein R3195_12335 [Gemmatimonadota bacterium]|nr:hypothetical protein [Gemmatimonadota bacterium]
MSQKSLWEDLKRRRVVRAAAAYIAIAFAVLEGAELVLPRLGLPDAILTILVICAIIGFPLALALSWAFRLTSGGVAPETPRADPAPGSEGDPTTAPRVVRLAALAAATALFAVAAWWWIPRAPAFRTVDVDPQALVILPFVVEAGASAELEYLREGMIDLLSTKLDGVSGLRVIDPHTTLAAVGAADDRRSAEEVRQIAAGLGAGRALQGTIVMAGPRLLANASVHSVDGQAPVDASVEGAVDGILDIVDRLALDLVTGGVLADDAGLVPLDELTTRSNEALRLYLDGLRAHRAGMGRADSYEPLARAAAMDSTFALASLWAGHAAVWFELVPEAEAHYARAVRHQDRLGPRGRLRVSAAAAAVDGRYSEAIPEYAAFVERYPEDLGGWFRYAEELAHSGEYLGQSVEEARPAYERAFALDPGMAPLYFHMAHIGGIQADTVALLGWARGLDSLGVDPLWPAVLRLMDGLVRRDSTQVYESYRVYRAAESTIPAPILAQSFAQLLGGVARHNPEGARALLADYTTRMITDTSRIVGTRRLARLDAGLGRFESADSALTSVAAGLGRLHPQDMAWVALHPDRDPGPALATARERLAAVEPPPGTGEEAGRHYLLARLALRADDAPGFAAAREALAGFVSTDAELVRFAMDLVHELDAVGAARAGDAETGLEALLKASYWHRRQGWLALPTGSYFDRRLADHHPMFLRAELLRQAGRESEAARWYRVAADGPWHRAPALRALDEMGFPTEGQAPSSDSSRSR